MNSKSTQSQGSSADEKAIRAIHYRMIEAWNADDAAAVYGTVFTVWALRQKSEHQRQGGRAFSLGTAPAVALTLVGILITFDSAQRLVR